MKLKNNWICKLVFDKLFICCKNPLHWYKHNYHQQKNNQWVTYYEHVSYLLKIHTIPCTILTIPLWKWKYFASTKKWNADLLIQIIPLSYLVMTAWELHSRFSPTLFFQQPTWMVSTTTNMKHVCHATSHVLYAMP